jgi:hypothetical protein
MFTLGQHTIFRCAKVDIRHQLLLLVLVLSTLYGVKALIIHVRNSDERRFWKSHPWAGLRKFYS